MWLFQSFYHRADLSVVFKANLYFSFLKYESHNNSKSSWCGMLNSWFYCSDFTLKEEVCHILWVFSFLREESLKDFGTFLFKLVKQTWGRYISDVWSAGSFIVMAAELAHGPGMTTFLFRVGVLSGGLHLQDPQAHVHHPWWAEAELCKGQRISWAVHTAWLMWLRVDGSLGWRCSSCTASSSLPPRLPATFQCSLPWASPPCWLWRCEEAALCLSPGCRSPADCSSAKDAHASAATLLGRSTDSLFILFPPPHPMHKSCCLQPNCIFFRQAVSGAMQMSFEMWRSGLYLSVNCLSGTDI